MTSQLQRLSVDWIELVDAQGHPDISYLDALVGDFRPLGVPDDLLLEFRDAPSRPLVELLSDFYLPNILGYAFVKTAVERGYLRQEKDLLVATGLGQRERLAARMDTGGVQDFDRFLRRARKPHFYQWLRRELTEDWLQLLNQRADLYAGMRVLSLGDGDARSLCFRHVGIRDVWVLDIDQDIVEFYAQRGVSGVCGDVRFFRDTPLAAFDLVTSYQIEGYQHRAIFESVYANLRPYGVYYTYFVGSDNERNELLAFLQDLERFFVLTDMRWQRGQYILRAVKYPEIVARSVKTAEDIGGGLLWRA
mgnify:CR=1 FL=1